MIGLFIASLFGTLLLVRIGAHKFHDMETYSQFNPRSSEAKTITGWLRRKTGYDWHHIHFGIVILIITSILIYLYGLNNPNAILLGIGLSMVADQITPLLDRKSNYFSKEKLLLSIIFHIIICIIAVIFIS
jgi:hypothetical protein